jgi:hypothetical protein
MSHSDAAASSRLRFNSTSPWATNTTSHSDQTPPSPEHEQLP